MNHCYYNKQLVINSFFCLVHYYKQSCIVFFSLSFKASKSEYAGIILWDCNQWTQLATLSGASLTVTQLAFSHDGQYLLSVSRDRTWTLYKRTQDEGKRLLKIYQKLKKKKIYQFLLTRILIRAFCFLFTDIFNGYLFCRLLGPDILFFSKNCSSKYDGKTNRSWET